MPCDSSVTNEQGDIFSIEGPYVLNCNESRTFNYIDKVTLWTDGTCSGTKKYPDFPGHLPVQNHSKTITDYFDYWKYWCRTVVVCIPSDYITMQRCFWEEKTSGLLIKKNGEVIEHYFVTLTVGPHLVAPYGFWKHTNNATGKESVFLNTANNNFLEGTNYNYSCIPVTSPGKCKTDYVMLELMRINSMPNIPSCATVVVLPTDEVTPITNFCSAIKSIKNIETQSIGIKSLSGTCDVKVSDKLGEITILSLDEGSYRFFSDIAIYLANQLKE
jgi:hypothetical protein